jgi:magnesium-transporting ATPase (P-type)
MVTGDHPKTAAAIARDVAILSPEGNLPTDMKMPAQEFDACCESQVSSSLLPPSIAGSLLAALSPCGIRIRVSPLVSLFFPSVSSME